jgi:protein O-GlcNAc transferase
MTYCYLKYKERMAKFIDVDPSDHIESYLVRGEWYEDRVLKFIEELQVKGSYLDAGAYIGNHSIFFSLFCPSNWVYSFEPQVPVHEKLVKNIEVNLIPNCTAYNVALSDKSGQGKFSSNVQGNGGMATLTGDPSVLTVPIWTIDYLDLNIKLMKVDVEGMELNVLRGADKTLEGVEHLFVEMPRDGFNNLAITHLLINKDFELREHFEEEQIYYFKKER